MGTLVNALSVIVGSAIGLLFRKNINEKITDSVVKVMGFCAMILGLTGLVGTMAEVNNGKLSFNGSLMLIVCMAIGTVIGEAADIDFALERMGKKLEKKLNVGGFSNGLVNASLIFCVGAMTIIGSFNDGISADHSVLFLKSALDGVTAVFLSASMGIGVMFSAVVVLVLQGSLTLCAVFLRPLVTDIMINGVCMIGYGIVMIIGLNMMQAVKIKTANLLPALVAATLWVAMGLKII